MDAPDPQRVTLRDLIQGHTDRTGESRRALGKRSGVAHQTLGYWFDGTIKTFPEPERLQAFSDATAIPLETVLLAAARTVGLRVTGLRGLAAMLPPGTDDLTDKDRAAVLAVVRQLVDARRELRPDLSKVQGLRLAEEPPAERATNRNDNDPM